MCLLNYQITTLPIYQYIMEPIQCKPKIVPAHQILRIMFFSVNQIGGASVHNLILALVRLYLIHQVMILVAVIRKNWKLKILKI